MSDIVPEYQIKCDKESLIKIAGQQSPLACNKKQRLKPIWRLNVGNLIIIPISAANEFLGLTPSRPGASSNFCGSGGSGARRPDRPNKLAGQKDINIRHV
ncbi:hypothetical protein GWI33_001831 [Rhynchophorus ferrugineus]|uniref:Uncharacterized protein n=1 Tax=Rhynchophorus ferrugineus TaxID=354439 RepID=A0A834MGR2_RHYFE|nr:hypothetical protein GWI33_001831 [Rhynchophorus ferrugineus]